MKLQTKIMANAVILAAFFTLAAGRLHAQNTNAVTISATIQSQGATNTSGGTTTIAAKTTAINAKQLLAWLAQDEFAEGNFPNTNFPSGAYLAVITTDTNQDYQVLTKSNTFLVDVSDILTGYYGSNSVQSAKIKTATGLYSPSGTVMMLAVLVFDDSAAVPANGPTVGLTMFMQGLQTTTIKDTSPNRSGVYTESVSAQTPNASGEGVYKGTPVLVTGSFGYSRTVKLNL
jgi:hypothetical protein